MGCQSNGLCESVIQNFEIHGKNTVGRLPSVFQSFEYFCVYCSERKIDIIITSLIKMNEDWKIVHAYLQV